MSDQSATSSHSLTAKKAAEIAVSSTPTGFLSHIKGFITRIDSLAETFPFTTIVIDASGQVAADERNNFLRDHGTSVDENSFALPSERLAAYHRLHEKLIKVQIASETVPRTFVVALVSEFDTFVSGLLRLFYEAHPDALRASDRSLTLGEILEFGSIEGAKDYVIEKEIEAVLRKSHSDQFDALEKRLKLQLRRDLDIWNDFIEITERRNLFVPTGGIVTRQYVDVCTRAGDDRSDVPLGSRLEASHDYFLHAHRVIFELGVKLGHVVWRKVLPEEMDSADTHFAGELMYDLVFNKRYAMAIKLGEFAIKTFKRFGSDYNRRMLVVNRSQAHKWDGDAATSERILDDEDWSATSAEFRLAVAALRDDLSSVIPLMEEIGATEQPGKVGYREWPLFASVRNSDEYQEAFQKIFGEPLSVVSVSEDAPEEPSGAESANADD